MGYEVDLGGAATEQLRRIQVGIAGTDAEVEALLGRPERLALLDLVAPMDGDQGQERVAGAQPVVVEQSTTTWSPPATGPAKTTSPGAEAATTVPGAVAYSRPRFPEFQFSAGGRNGSTIGASTGGR